MLLSWSICIVGFTTNYKGIKMEKYHVHLCTFYANLCHVSEYKFLIIFTIHLLQHTWDPISVKALMLRPAFKYKVP